MLLCLFVFVLVKVDSLAPPQPPRQGAIATGIYRNLFVEVDELYFKMKKNED